MSGLVTHQRDLIAGWCRAGLPWRTWTVREMVAVLYSQITEALEPRDRRKLFLLADDVKALAALDREMMGQTTRGGGDRG